MRYKGVTASMGVKINGHSSNRTRHSYSKSFRRQKSISITITLYRLPAELYITY